MKSPLGELAKLRAQVPVSLAPVASTFRGAFSGSTSGDATTAIESMAGVGTLFNVVSTLANSTAGCEWKLYRTPGPRQDPDSRREITTPHQAKVVWDRPNAFMTGMHFREAQQQHVDLTGESCWVVDYGGAPFPTGIWPVRPDRIEPVPDRRQFLAGYVYTGPDGERVPLRVQDVVRVMMPNPEDPYRGLGPVQALMYDLDSERYSAAWNRNFFRNSAEPGGVIEVPEGLDDSDFQRINRRWNEQHRGVNAAHRVAILESGMKWIDRSFSQRDMQFAELRTVGQDIIRQAFGYPKFAAGEVSDVNRATAEASDRWFDKHLTVVRLNRIRDALNHQFLPLFGTTGQGVEFDYVSPVENDETAEAELVLSRGNALTYLVTAGASFESAAAAVGLPELKAAPPKPVPEPLRAPGQPAVEPAPDQPAVEPAPARKALPAAPEPPAARVVRVLRGELVPDGDDDSDADNTHLNGCMIALMPSPADAARLALPGGESADELHCTLLYLGPTADAWPPRARAAVVNSVASWLGGLPPVQGRVFGAALWNPDGEKPAWVWSVGDAEDAPVPMLGALHDDVNDAVEEVASLILPDQHEPWAAHICAAYSGDTSLLPAMLERTGPVTFDRVRISFGDDDVDVMLDGTAAAGTYSDGSVPYDQAQLLNAQRWKVVAHLDDNTCGPCRDNDGRTYKSRAQAYANYPDGHGYVHCVGAEYGNKCRCRVVRRGRKGGK